MAVTNYHSVDGVLIGETTSGTRTDYLTDGLGSITSTVNQSAAIVNTYRYKPYGARLAKIGAGADPQFQWVGSWGYQDTNLAMTTHYIRDYFYADRQGILTTTLQETVTSSHYATQNPTSISEPLRFLQKGPARTPEPTREPYIPKTTPKSSPARGTPGNSPGNSNAPIPEPAGPQYYPEDGVTDTIFQFGKMCSEWHWNMEHTRTIRIDVIRARDPQRRASTSECAKMRDAYKALPNCNYLSGDQLGASIAAGSANKCEEYKKKIKEIKDCIDARLAYFRYCDLSKSLYQNGARGMTANPCGHAKAICMLLANLEHYRAAADQVSWCDAIRYDTTKSRSYCKEYYKFSKVDCQKSWDNLPDLVRWLNE